MNDQHSPKTTKKRSDPCEIERFFLPLQRLLLKTRGRGQVAPARSHFQTHRVRASKMYNYLPWPSNMRTADQVLSMRIQEGSAGYGVYVMLLELLRDAENRRLVFNPKHLAFAMNEPNVELVQRVVQDYALFTLGDDGKFSSPWLEAQMNEYDAKKAAAVAAGKRGAARRYGKQYTIEAEEDRVPMGGAMAAQQDTDSNITQHNEPNKINPTKSKLLGMTWKGWDGEHLFALARKKEPLIDDLSREVIKSQQGKLNARAGQERHNLGAIVDVCDYFKVGVGMFRFLAEYTNYGRIGSPEIIRMLALEKECRQTKFTPKYPAEYVLVKLLEPLQGQ